MNPLRTLENMIAGLVEGTFGRVFRAEVRPMELAHKLAREMDENTTVSVSRVYAPNEYAVWLSPRDRDRYEGVEDEVIDELCAYLLEHARAEGLALASGPHIAFHTDEALRLGEFGIEARTARPEHDERESPPQRQPSLESPSPARRAPPVAAEPVPAAGHTMIFSNAERVQEAVRQTGGRRARALLVVAGRRLQVPPAGAVIGRSRDCDVVLEDAGVSRRHAELRPSSSSAWTLEDLGSTNGVRVDGRTVSGSQELRGGERIGVGSTELLFEIAS